MSRCTNSRINVELEQGTPVVSLRGDLGSARLAGEQSLACRLAADIPSSLGEKLVIDMSGLSFGGAELLTLLIELSRRASGTRSGLVLAAVPEWFRRVLAVTRLDVLWQIYPTRDEAVSAVGRRGR